MSNYTLTGAPPAQTRGISTSIRAEFVLIQTAISSKGDISGQTWTGTHTLPATTFGVTAAFGSSGTAYATLDFVNAVATSAALPGQVLGFLRSTGTVATFGTTHTGYAQKEVKGADITCAATIDLSVATGNLVHITGSTGPVTAITVASGAEYTVVWDSTPIINHNATTLILPGSANILVAAGDVWKIRGDGVGNSRVVEIQKANAAPNGPYPYLHVREEQTSGTAGGGSTASDITQTRVLNTVKINTMGATLSSNTITLLAGTYQARISAPSTGNASPNNNKAFLYNSSDSTYVLIGQTGVAVGGGGGTGIALVTGQFTITASKNFTVRHFTSLTVATSGLGSAISSGQAEVYTEAEFWKVT